MIPKPIAKSISILGCGWYGFAMAKRLIADGYMVKGSTTSQSKLSSLADHGIVPFLINFDGNGAMYDRSFFDSEVLIIALPPKRTSGEHQKYPEKLKRIADAAEKGSVKFVLMISSTSVYAEVNREVGETEIPSPDTDSGKAILEAENLLKSYSSFATTILRFGGLIGPGRNLARFFAGKSDIENGLAPINLIHLEDCIQVTLHILDKAAFGYTFNACSPDHPTRKDLYTLATEITGLDRPEFLSELKKWKLINGNYIVNELNYKYLVNKWSEFLSPDKL